MNLRFAGWRVFVGICAFAEQLQAQPSNALPTLIPAYAELPPTFWEQHKTIVISGICALIASAAFVVWKIFLPKPAPVLPPEKVARDALTRLRMQPEDGKMLSEASQILRRYVGAVFNFAGGEMTTAEFCTAISQHKQVGEELSGAIASFLRECDVRKFSSANSVAPVNAVLRAMEFVSQIHNEARKLAGESTKP